MALIGMRQLPYHSAENDFGLPVEQIQDVIKHAGVRKVKSLAVMQVAHGAGELDPKVN